MRYQILFLFIILSFLINCGGSPETPTTPANTASTNTTKNTNSNSPISVTTPTPGDKVNEGQTIAPIVEAYFAALQKKDEAGAKKYLSAAAFKYYETEAKGENKTWFAFVLEENDPVDKKREVRNEKIEGDKGTAELQGGNLGRWTTIAFIKENGEWKFDSPVESYKHSELKKTDMPSAPAK